LSQFISFEHNHDSELDIAWEAQWQQQLLAAPALLDEAVMKP
jgi:hypothetical protein